MINLLWNSMISNSIVGDSGSIAFSNVPQCVGGQIKYSLYQIKDYPFLPSLIEDESNQVKPDEWDVR